MNWTYQLMIKLWEVPWIFKFRIQKYIWNCLRKKNYLALFCLESQNKIVLRDLFDYTFQTRCGANDVLWLYWTLKRRLAPIKAILHLNKMKYRDYLINPNSPHTVRENITSFMQFFDIYYPGVLYEHTK